MTSLSQGPGRKRRGDRRFARLPTSIPGALGGQAPHEVLVLEMSVGGCLVRSSRCPEPGSIADLRCVLGAEAFEAKTRVCETSVDGEAEKAGASFLVGLEFLGLSASAQDLLRQFLDSSLRKGRRGARPPS